MWCRNIRYFHAHASTQQNKNTILGLSYSNKVWYDSFQSVEGPCLDYFYRLFTSQSLNLEDIGKEVNLILLLISMADVAQFDRSFKTKEV